MVFMLSKSNFLACVFGNPIAQSKSPIIHKMFAEQLDIPLIYNKQLAPVDGFESAASQFFQQANAIGANVTMPFKHYAFNWVGQLSSQAQRAGAVNTIIKTQDGFVGDNTDGVGLVNDLQNHGVMLKDAKVLLVGAGGAAQGALPALVDSGIENVVIYNRTVNKAQYLVDVTNDYNKGLARVFGHSHENVAFDLIINATSLSLSGALPDLPNALFKKCETVYDMVYLPHPTIFLEKAKSLGAKKAIDGLGMLVHQAAHSFYLWFGEQPNPRPVYDHLKSLNT